MRSRHGVDTSLVRRAAVSICGNWKFGGGGSGCNASPAWMRDPIFSRKARRYIAPAKLQLTLSGDLARAEA